MQRRLAPWLAQADRNLRVLLDSSQPVIGQVPLCPMLQVYPADHRASQPLTWPRTCAEHFVFAGNRRPVMNRRWIEDLAETTNSVGGLFMIPEPPFEASTSEREEPDDHMDV